MVTSDFSHVKKRTSNLQHGRCKKQRLSLQNYILCPLSAPMFFANTGAPCKQLAIIPGKLYTFGRSRSTCDIVFEDSRVSRQHCQLYLDSDQHKLFLLDGTVSASERNSSVEIFQNIVQQNMLCSVNGVDEIPVAKYVKSSLNGIYVNRSRPKLGHCRVLSLGDQVSLVCDHTADPAFGPAVGFIIRTGGASSSVTEAIDFDNRINGSSCRQMACAEVRLPLDLACANAPVDSAEVNLFDDSVFREKMPNGTEILSEKCTQMPTENRHETLQEKMTQFPTKSRIGTLKEKRTQISDENSLTILKENFDNNNVSKPGKEVGLLRSSTGSLIEASKKLRCSLVVNQNNEHIRSNDEILRLVSKDRLASTNKTCKNFEPGEVKMDLPLQVEVGKAKNLEEERRKLPTGAGFCMNLAEDTREAKQDNSRNGAGVKREGNSLNFVKEAQASLACDVGVKSQAAIGSCVRENKNQCSGTLCISNEEPQERVLDSAVFLMTKTGESSNGHITNLNSLHKEDKKSAHLILRTSSVEREETVGDFVKENKSQDTVTLWVSKGEPQDKVVSRTASLVTKAIESSNGHKGMFASFCEEDKQLEPLILRASSLLRRCRDILRRNTCAAYPETYLENSAQFIVNSSNNAKLTAAQEAIFVPNTDENSDGILCKRNTGSSKESQISAHLPVLNSGADINKKENQAKEIETKHHGPAVDACDDSMEHNNGTGKVNALSSLEYIYANRANTSLHRPVTEKHINWGEMQGCAHQQALSKRSLHNQIPLKDIQGVNVMPSPECQDDGHLRVSRQVPVSENEYESSQMKWYSNQKSILATVVDSEGSKLKIENVSMVNNEQVARSIRSSKGMVDGQQSNQALIPHNKKNASAVLPESENIMRIKGPCVTFQSHKEEEEENTTSRANAAVEEHTSSGSNIILGTEKHANGNKEKGGVIFDILQEHSSVESVDTFTDTVCVEVTSAKSLDYPIIGNFQKKVYSQHADGNRQEQLSDLLLETEEQVSCSNANKQVPLDLMMMHEGVEGCGNLQQLCFGAISCPPKEELQEHHQNIDSTYMNKVQSGTQAPSRELNVAHGLDCLKDELYRMTDQGTNIEEDHAPHMQVDSSSSSGREGREENDEALEERYEMSKKSSDKGASLFTGDTFYLNHLEFMDSKSTKHPGTVSLLDLLTPVDNLLRIFATTFTSDILWFMSLSKLPNDLPVTIACHNSDRCWSKNSDQRWSKPYPERPNLTVVYPHFPNSIAFGKGHRQGVGCHHPKMLILQRRESLRVIITSANLNPCQWLHVTNTVWWQDFPRRSTQDYQSIFSCPLFLDSKNIGGGDFAAQLAGFLATLVVDVPSEAHWIAELAQYDFKKAAGYLVASVPGLHGCPYLYPQLPMTSQNAISKTLNWQSSRTKYIGAVRSTVVGLSFRFRAAADPKGARLKALAMLLRNGGGTMEGMLPVLLKRAVNVPADSNAISVIVCDMHGCSENVFLQEDLMENCSPPIPSDTGYVHLGFLRKDTAQWVAPLWDGGLFSFAAYIWPQEALAVASGRSNNKVQLILYIFQGQKFSQLSIMPSNKEHHVSMCNLVASLQRPWGLWRLQEVLSQYKWPDSHETDFIYGSSSIGTSLDACFLAAFSAAAGRKSIPLGGSDESDPEWGCWTAQHESENPSIRILFPTIERVKHGKGGTLPYSRLLCFAESTWERLKSAHVLHDAIPHPSERTEFPMHVKVARRRFRYHSDAPSFGWIYCGSHNFSPAAWGRPLHKASDGKAATSAGVVLGSTLHICNYEIGLVFIVPPPEDSKCLAKNGGDLERFALPFVMPAPKYQESDQPATKKAMCEAQTEVHKFLQVEEKRVVENLELVSEEAPVEAEDLNEDSEQGSGDGGQEEEEEEEHVYAETLWSQIDSCHS